MLDSVYSDQHGWAPFLGLERAVARPVVIKSVELLRFAGHYLVRTTSTDGAAGIAVCNHRAEYLHPMFNGLVAPAFVGRDARELEQLVNDVYTHHANYKWAGTPFWNCVAYAEAAVFDLLGRVAGRSVGELIGTPFRGEIPVYLSSMRRDTTPEQEVEWLKKRLDQTKARAVKIKVGGRMRNDEDSMPGRTEALIPLARKVFGRDTTLLVDANGSYGHAKAIEVGKMLEDHGYSWFEEPCPFEQYEETKRVADALTIDVAGGEQDCNLAQFRTMIRERVVDVVQPDLMYNGGLVRALRVARMAAEAGVKVTPHSPKYNPEMATLLHFASVVRHTSPFMEYLADKVTFEPWYTPAFEIREGGFVSVPRGPGLGVEYDPSIWEKAEAVS